MNSGCLMLGLDINKFSELTKDFENVERYPHITVLYGLPDDPNIVDYLKSVSLDFKDYTFQLSNISYFESNSNDVLKFGLVDDKLIALNKLLTEKYSVISDYPEYIPHSTISFLRKNKAHQYVKEIYEEIKVVNICFMYKDNGKKIKIFL